MRIEPEKPWRLMYHNLEEAIEQVVQWGEPFQLAYIVTEIPPAEDTGGE